MEIERKFLIHGFPDDEDVYKRQQQKKKALSAVKARNTLCRMAMWFYFGLMFKRQAFALSKARGTKDTVDLNII